MEVKKYEKCAFSGCSATKVDNNNIPLHRFPTKDSSRVKLWLDNAGNSQLTGLKMNSLRKYGLCNEHFEESAFTNETKQKLNWSAVPKRFRNDSHQSLSAPLLIVPSPTIPQPIQKEGLESRTIIPHCSVSSICNPAKKQKIEQNDKAESKCSNIITPREKLRGSNIIISGTDVSSDTLNKTQPSPGLSTSHENWQRNICCEKWCDENERLHVDKSKLNRQYQELLAQNDKIFSENVQLKNELRNARAAIKKIPQKISKARAEVTLEEFLENRAEPLQPAAATMIRLQLHKPGAKCDQEEKDLAKQFFYHSHAAYSRMRKAGCNFPAESTVRDWISQLDVKPGFCGGIFQVLEKKMAALPPDERLCSLAWDEMSLKEYEEYSMKYDCIEGLVDLGPLGRKDEPAKYVFSLNLTSLASEPSKRWRQPIAFVLSGKGGMAAGDIDSLVRECLMRLEKIGVDVRLLVCDQGNQNQKLFNEIWNIHINNPIWKFNGKMYYVSYDFPHLIKRLVVHLRTHGAIYDEHGQCLISWSDLTWAKQCDILSTSSHLLDHIKPIHLAPNGFQSMNVERAFQMFGKRYGEAIKLAGEAAERTVQSTERMQIFVSPTWRQSAEFVLRMNNTIDACNSAGAAASNPNKRPLSKNNPQIEETILDLLTWVPKWRVHHISPKNKKVVPTIPPCFYGLQITANALLGVYHTVSQDFPDFEFATARGNQDGTESWNQLLRGRNGPCDNPTARMVRLTARHVLSLGSITTGSQGNVKCDDNNYLSAPKSSLVSKAFNAIPLANVIDIDDTGNSNNQEEDAEAGAMCEGIDEVSIREYVEAFEVDERLQAVTSAINKYQQCSFYEANAITFFAGYVAFRTLQLTKCDRCRDIMTKSPMDERNDNELYIEYREYENLDVDAPAVTKLHRPTEKFARIFGIQLNTFERVHKNYWAQSDLIKKIMREIEKDMNIFDSTWFDKSNSCYQHRITAAKFMSKVKIISRTRQRNQEHAAARVSTYSKNRKIKKVTHN